MEENLVKGFKLKNGDVYKYDYESLGDKPFYDIIEVGDVIIPETTCYFNQDGAFSVGQLDVSWASFPPDLAQGDNFVLYIDNNLYKVYFASEGFVGIYDMIMLFPEGSYFIIMTNKSLIGEHVIKFCSISSEDKKIANIENSRILKMIMIGEGQYYFMTDKNLSMSDFIGSYILSLSDFSTSAVLSAGLNSNSGDGTILLRCVNDEWLKYNPDTGNAIVIDLDDPGSSLLYNVNSKANTNLTANDFAGATIYHQYGII